MFGTSSSPSPQPLRALILAAGFLCSGGPATAQKNAGGEANVAEMVQRVLARSQAVFSGRIEYRDVMEYDGKEDLSWLRENVFTFSGTSWAVYPGGAGTPNEASHRGNYVRVLATRQPDGRTTHTAELSLERPINADSKRLPLFAGSLWDECSRDYIRANAGKAVSRGEAEANGVRTHVLEWAVPAADIHKAFGYMTAVIERGGTLRLHVAPQHGYVLPRVEHVGGDGNTVKSYDSHEFFAAAPGIFFPRRSALSYPAPEQGKRNAVVFTLKKVEKINEPIPDDVFKVYLPIGTVVADSRSGKGSHMFQIKEEGKLPIAGVGDLVAVGSPPSFWRRGTLVALAVGTVVGLTGAALFLLLRRRRAGLR